MYLLAHTGLIDIVCTFNCIRFESIRLCYGSFSGMREKGFLAGKLKLGTSIST